MSKQISYIKTPKYGTFTLIWAQKLVENLFSHFLKKFPQWCDTVSKQKREYLILQKKL